MKLTIKTLDQRTIKLEFNEERTVWDLKMHLAQLPEIGGDPNIHQLIYAGRVLDNEASLKSYSIDERRFLVIMKKDLSLKAKRSNDLVEQTSTTRNNEGASSLSSSSQQVNIAPDQSTTTTQRNSTVPTLAMPTPIVSSTTNNNSELSNSHTATEDIVRNIMEMGYAESDVRRALLASFYDPQRAIEYLIDGIPNLPDIVNSGITQEEHPLNFLRSDPQFTQMREFLRQNPHLIEAVMSSIGATNPVLLNIIRNHQDDFLQLLNENDIENATNRVTPPQLGNTQEGSPAQTEIVLTEAERQAVNRLVTLGFPINIVLEAFIACDKNEEATADFLFRHLDEN